MQKNSNLSCLPFYTSLEEQDFRKWYAYGEKYLHRMPNDYLVPFYFVIPSSGTISDVKLYKVCCDELVGSIKTAMVANKLVVKNVGGIYEVIYYASPVSSLNLDKGLYYLKITIGTTDYYSDIFCVDSKASIESHSTKVEWWNMENLEYDGGFVPYGESESGASFRNVLYLDTEIGMPTYNFTEEGEERNGHFFPTKQISEKSYNMTFYAPEYLCDAMRLIRMADYATVTDRLGRSYNVEQFEMETEWLEQGHYADVGCTFQTDTIVKKVGKAYTI